MRVRFTWWHVAHVVSNASDYLLDEEEADEEEVDEEVDEEDDEEVDEKAGQTDWREEAKVWLQLEHISPMSCCCRGNRHGVFNPPSPQEDPFLKVSVALVP